MQYPESEEEMEEKESIGTLPVDTPKIKKENN